VHLQFDGANAFTLLKVSTNDAKVNFIMPKYYLNENAVVNSVATLGDKDGRLLLGAFIN
jgi:hypothetical protein